MARTPKSHEEPFDMWTADMVIVCPTYLAQLVCKSAAFSKAFLWTSEQSFSGVLSSSTRMAMGTICSRPLMETIKHSIFYSCSLPLGLHIFRYSSHVPSSEFSFNGTVSSFVTNVFDCWDTNIASGLRLVYTMFEKTNLVSRCTLSSQLWSLSSIDFRLGALVSGVSSPCLTNASVLASGLCFLHLQRTS